MTYFWQSQGTNGFSISTISQVVPSSEDLATVKAVCNLVTKRAAALLATSFTALTEFVLEKSGNPIEGKTAIVVDGGVYEKFHTLRDQIKARIDELLKLTDSKEVPEVVLRPAHGGSLFGAAALAAAS